MKISMRVPGFCFLLLLVFACDFNSNNQPESGIASDAVTGIIIFDDRVDTPPISQIRIRIVQRNDDITSDSYGKFVSVADTITLRLMRNVNLFNKIRSSIVFNGWILKLMAMFMLLSQILIIGANIIEGDKIIIEIPPGSGDISGSTTFTFSLDKQLFLSSQNEMWINMPRQQE